MKNLFSTLIVLLAVYLSASAQSTAVSGVWAEMQNSRVAVHYSLSTNKPADLNLEYSIDDGRSWLPCKTISGDLSAQTSGNKTIVWDCIADNIITGTFVFKVNVAEFIQMVFVQGGVFAMGCTAEQGNDCEEDEKPAHQVKVNDFYIGRYPVTQAQWKAVMGAYPSGLFNTGCEDCPVEGVSWNDVQEFIRKLNEQTVMNYRLPTEAEWEYAARGGKQSKGYKYSGSNNIDEVACYMENYNNNRYGKKGTTNPVGTKKPNELGIYDMSGNVWEWCADWYDGYSSDVQTNPAGPFIGSYRVLRGGSWYSPASICRVSFRNFYLPTDRDSRFGFRLARSL